MSTSTLTSNGTLSPLNMDLDVDIDMDADLEIIIRELLGLFHDRHLLNLRAGCDYIHLSFE